MLELVGHVRELVRYPVKSMAGVCESTAKLGWHGLEGDRRFAFRRIDEKGGFPWLTASRVPQLVLYRPIDFCDDSSESLPTRVATPSGELLELYGSQLQSEISERFGGPVELMRMNHGIFDDSAISLISSSTVAGIGRSADLDMDRRRFRANILVETIDDRPFAEDGWIDGSLLFGDESPRPSIRITVRDVRCMMVNLDPDTAAQNPRVLASIVALNQNNAGVYGTVLTTGTLRVGDPIYRLPGIELSCSPLDARS